MSIYRGAGGAGDAVADSSSEALLVRELAVEVQADADAAAASATAAAGSASSASSSASAAATSASNAATSATNASNSASAASTSATNAANSATAAQTAETAAELAETNAETAETNAETAATNAASSASAASTSATNASNSASAASTSATNASNSASAASTSASNASTSATAAAGSASSASTSASNASTSATNASSSASSASTSATTATTQAGIATTKAGEAATSATNAASSASSASTSASTATTQATNASNSASAAATSATNASNSASSASTSATNAANSATAAAASAASINLSSIAITGGSINGTTVGATTPSTGKFTTLEATGVTTVQAGTVSAPAITTTGDTNTGIFFPAADTIAFTEGGVEAMRINSSANVGIGTTNPSGRLQVSGLNDTGGVSTFISNASDIGNTTPFIDLSFTQRSNNADGGKIRAGRDGIYSATPSTMDSYMAFFTAINNADTERMRINSDGNVGIGTSSPSYKLDVVGAGAQSIRVASSNGDLASLRMLSSGNNEWSLVSDTVMRFRKDSTEYMRIDSNGNLLVRTTSASYNATNRGNITIGGTDSSLVGFQVNGTNSGYVYHTSVNLELWNQVNGAIQFGTNNAERMRIASDGNVAIGTTNTSGARLTVRGAGTTSATASFEAATSGGNTRFYVQDDGTTRFFGSSNSETMRVASDGNVGIGISNPGFRLDVQAPSCQVNAVSTTGTNITYFRAANTAGSVLFGIDNSGGGVTGTPYSNMLYSNTTTPWVFFTNAVERMRITSGGLLLVGTTTTQGGGGHTFNLNGVGAQTLQVQNSATSDPFGVFINYSGAAPNGTSNPFIQCNDTVQVRMTVRSNGGIANFSANNVNLSDAREKTNVELAGSYLDKICAIPVKTFNYINQNFDEDDGLTLGVIAQDVQAVAPELVMESDWGTKEESRMRLSIYQTDLQYALMKCIQELKAELDSVKAELQTLKGN